MDFAILKDYGIDSESGIKRCLGNAELYAALLRIFLDDRSFEQAEDALEREDYPGLYRCMHELKGACGNAEMTDLYKAVSPLVALLRLDGGTDVEITLLFARVKTAYERAKEGIALAVAAEDADGPQPT